MRRRTLNALKSLFAQDMRNRLAPVYHTIEDSYAAGCALFGLGRRPDFLIIGAQKSGTTTLFSALTHHPLIAEPFRKEIGYFDRKFEYRSQSWYFANFNTRPEQLTGEATPDYLFFPQAPQRVREMVPDARLIVILRDPVKRAISHYYHELRLGRETLDLRSALEREEARLATGYNAPDDPASRMTLAQRQHYFSYRARGYYGEQIARWLGSFPAERFLFLSFDDLKADTASVAARTLDFLCLPSVPAPGKIQNENTGLYKAGATPLPEGFATSFAEDQARLRDLVGFTVMAEKNGSQTA